MLSTERLCSRLLLVWIDTTRGAEFVDLAHQVGDTLAPMDEVRQFIRYVIPGLLFLAEIAVFFRLVF